jgi:hypothetical protein
MQDSGVARAPAERQALDLAQLAQFEAHSRLFREGGFNGIIDLPRTYRVPEARNGM